MLIVMHGSAEFSGKLAILQEYVELFLLAEIILTWFRNVAQDTYTYIAMR